MIKTLAGLALAMAIPPVAAFALATMVGAHEAAPVPARAPAPARAAPAPEPARVAVPAPKPAPVPAPEPQGLVIKRVLDIGGPIKFGDYYWDEAGAPAEGPVVITVDLAAQTLSVFRDGYEIGATAILYGDDDKPTPLGTFPITQKKKDHISNLYHAPMPYMQRLTNDGISIHGSEVEWGYATHGCVGVPTEFAAKLFAVTRLGDKVIITRGKRIGVGDTIAAGGGDPSET